MDGKGQSPFDPVHKHTAVLVGKYQVSQTRLKLVFSGHSEKSKARQLSKEKDGGNQELPRAKSEGEPENPAISSS